MAAVTGHARGRAGQVISCKGEERRDLLGFGGLGLGLARLGLGLGIGFAWSRCGSNSRSSLDDGEGGQDGEDDGEEGQERGVPGHVGMCECECEPVKGES